MHRTIVSRALRSSLLLVAAFLFAGDVGVAASHPRDVATTTLSHSARPVVLQANEVAGFFDVVMQRDLTRLHIPGAVVAVVQNGEVLFQKGYGYAVLAERRPFDPERSLVRIASISKLFTWTAVMQLVEQGELDLQTDVNEYLTSFQIPDTYPEPITLTHLMTHSAGFEDRTLGIAARRKQDVPPLGEYLAEHLPARIRPPGQLSAYSNHGAALAGHIVAEVSGVPYEQYIQEQILVPLGMARSTAWEPVPDHLLPELAASYEYENGDYETIAFRYDMLVPDGSISATAADMAHFMVAHLQDGCYRDGCILDKQSVARMHSQSFTHHPRLSGWAHGFMERTINDRHVLMHDGSWEGFQSALLLIPEHDVGLFISYNSWGGGEAATQLLPAFFDRFFPAPAAPPAPVASGVSGDSQPFAGFYRPARYSARTVEKVVTLLGPSRLIARGDGALQFAGRRWVEVEPLLYRNVEGTEMLALLPDDEGRPAAVAIDRGAYERIPWYESLFFSLALLGSWAVVVLTTLVAWALRGALNQRRGLEASESEGVRLGRVAVGVAGLLGLVFTILFTIVLLGDTSEYLFGVPPSLRLLMLLPIVVALLTIVSMVAAPLVWRDRGRGLGAKLHYTVVVLAMVVFVWFLNTWNLLGFRFG